MDEDALTYVHSRVGRFAPSPSCSLLFFVAMASWQDDHSWASSRWQGSSSKSDGGKGMCKGGWGTEGWGVHPGSPPLPTYPSQPPPPPPHPQLQPAFGPQPRVGPTPPLYTPPNQLPGFQAGFRTGYQVGWAQGYHVGQQEEPELGKGKTNTPELQVLTSWKEMTLAAAMLATSSIRINIIIHAPPKSGPTSATMTTR